MTDPVYLERHPTARTQYRYPRRATVTGAIVVHTAENTVDLDGVDGGAEAVARFISTRTDAAGSYHTIVDSDSIVQVGRFDWEMFGEGTGGNRWALHLSFATQAHLWPTLPERWVTSAIHMGALAAVAMAHHVDSAVGVTIPPKRITAAQYRAGEPGFIAHGTLDPGRRTDPGDGFPWAQFLTAYAEATNQQPPTNDGDTTMATTYCLPESRRGYVTRIQEALLDLGVDLGTTGPAGNGVDEDPGRLTAQGVESARDRIRQLHDMNVELVDERDREMLRAERGEALAEGLNVELADTRNELADSRNLLAAMTGDRDRVHTALVQLQANLTERNTLHTLGKLCLSVVEAQDDLFAYYHQIRRDNGIEPRGDAGAEATSDDSTSDSDPR